MTYPQEHTGSYYAASANDHSKYATLRGSVSADVCVVGAGFTGISTAIFLAERGYDVCVLEANRVGFGASGRNGGQMIAGISGENRITKHHGPGIEKQMWDMRWAGHRIIRERVAKYGIACDLKSGYLDVAIKERHLRDLEADHARLSRHGFAGEFRLLSREETRSTIGTDAYIGALFNGTNGHLHPLNLCAGEARVAASLGARLYEQSPVRSITHGDTVCVSTADGNVNAKFAVLAGNAYQFFNRKLRARFFPVRSYIIATEALTPEQVADVNPQDLAVCDPNFVLEYFRLSADKRLLFGGRCNYFGEDPEEIRSQLRPRMQRVYPQLSGIGIDYAWGGTIAVPLNRVPQLGRLAPNVFYAQGYSGHGVNVTHLVGEILADAVAGTLERFDVFAGIKPIRIPGASVFANQMVSLGMMYYGLKDRL
ncbi:MAG: FAD-binding oxidoreductase [Gammaproteobacteria bacterium]|nr:FAD-binding oxidoreductase [Gammaproteobacteria bacterium]MDH4316646.1 FAD-binding oxidoreductase [Gammaproteobacteria bacterium]MDH5215810.1 FAD-binding oxidoreductase [Gammaproteobacteria bacterium]MDH5500425.1 FAD-binding oxidoreductase [Gammaproteobacteria bacterium]